MRGFGSHWSASLLIRSHPVRSFWLRRVSVRIQSTMIVVAERRHGVEVGRHRVIGKEACHHLPQPLSLAGDRIVHPAPKLLLDLPHLGPVYGRVGSAETAETGHAVTGRRCG